jgi:predicted RNA-binding Zn ribbon-like protein
MNLMVQQIPFLFVGNHLCLDFINTEVVMSGQPTDLLPSWKDVVAWLIEAGLVTGKEAKESERVWDRHGPETLKEAKAFRSTMRHMAERVADGKPVPQAALDTINHLLRHRVGYSQISRQNGRFERKYESKSEDTVQLLGLLAEAASDLLVTCDLSLVKKCQNPACVLFFYDTTKNHARRWCSMSLCGNRSKVAAHYHRHRRKT